MGPLKGEAFITEKNLSYKRSEVNKGSWTAEEDRKLAEIIAVRGAKSWNTIASKAGEAFITEKNLSYKRSEVNKGSWTAEEDRKLAEIIAVRGAKSWNTIASKAVLKRCGKSCRLKWMNYLRPTIKRGNISDQEGDLMLGLHKLLENRWFLITGRLPGRTDNEIKNYWKSHFSKKIEKENNGGISERQGCKAQKRTVENTKDELREDNTFTADVRTEISASMWMNSLISPMRNLSG